MIDPYSVFCQMEAVRQMDDVAVDWQDLIIILMQGGSASDISGLFSSLNFTRTCTCRFRRLPLHSMKCYSDLERNSDKVLFR
jgi:hypothetical protein